MAAGQLKIQKIQYAMIGEFSVGKTCMILRSTNNPFTDVLLNLGILLIKGRHGIALAFDLTSRLSFN
jgi:hypothetical protein